MVNQQGLRIIFMGTPAFSVPCLRALIQAGHEILAVYTQPPRPKDRGHHVVKSPVHLEAEARGIPVYTPTTLKNEDVQREFRAHNADVAVVVAYGLLLPKIILEIPRLGCLNVHASILPRWRGAAPIQRAIEAGDKETGVTIMVMDEGLDTGSMLLLKTTPLEPTTTAQRLHDTLMLLGAQAIVEALPDYANGTLKPILQPIDGITYAAKLTKQEAQLDFRQSAQILERKIRAFTPWPGVWLLHENTRLKIHTTELLLQQGKPGEVLSGPDLVIACKQDALRILTLQRPGGSPLPAEEFLRGYPIPAGTMLPCPDTN